MFFLPTHFLSFTAYKEKKKKKLIIKSKLLKAHDKF